MFLNKIVLFTLVLFTNPYKMIFTDVVVFGLEFEPLKARLL